jgi:hypothetical protein
MTVYDVSPHSTKKLAAADIVVGVQAEGSESQSLVSRRLDPNRSHPYGQKGILEKLANDGVSISTHTFQALVWKYDLRNEQRYCWVEDETQMKKWSADVVALIKSYSQADIDLALKEYVEHQKRARAAKNKQATP